MSRRKYKEDDSNLSLYLIWGFNALAVFAALFFLNPSFHFLYAALLALVYWAFNFRKQWKPWKIVLLYFVAVVITLTVFSVSPRLRIVEFKWLNTSWHEADAQVDSVKGHWVGGYKGSGHPAADIYYTYNVGAKSYVGVEQRAVERDLYLLNFKDRDVNQANFDEFVRQLISKNKFKLFVSSSGQQYSKLFVNTDYVDFKNSNAINLYLNMLTPALLTPIIMFLYYRIRGRKLFR